MKRLFGFLSVAVLSFAWATGTFQSSPAVAQECTAVPSQENAFVITVLPENAGTLAAVAASGGIIQCE
jgi:hypothetical protein